MAVGPKTYRGYDKDGVCVSSYSARDANEVINPAEVKAAVEKVKEVASTEFPPIATELTNLTTDVDNAIVVKGTKMTETIEEIAEAIKTVPGQLADSLDELVTTAQTQHDKYQEEFNRAAYNACYTNGAVTVN